MRWLDKPIRHPGPSSPTEKICDRTPFCGIFHRSFLLHFDNFPALQIDDDRSIAIAPAPAPVIDANDSYGLSITDVSRIVFELPQNGIVAHSHS